MDAGDALDLTVAIARIDTRSSGQSIRGARPGKSAEETLPNE